MVSTDWSVLGKVSLVIASGPDVIYGIASSGFAAFLGLELKYSCGHRDRVLVNRLKALFLRLFDASQNLLVLWAYCLSEWSCKGEGGRWVRVLDVANLNQLLPWLVWLSGLSAGLQTKGSPVRFPVRVHAWVADQVPGSGLCEREPYTDISLPLFLSPFPSLKISK